LRCLSTNSKFGWGEVNMRICVKCKTDVPDEATACSGCGLAYMPLKVASSSSVDTEQKPSVIYLVRPDGMGLKGVGAAAMGIGVMIFVISYVNMGSDFEAINPIAIALKWIAALLGAALANLGLLLWLVGHIVYAISFLPRKAEN
jgi:ribosomal protein L40E